ncbi:unnamed protein product, partial [Onchocerca ochengi]|uniref:Uncharacterized protein n=1 Tax=Onchocerca ochengi TaxID=42157 RepID=A0A182EK85_ONCOC
MATPTSNATITEITKVSTMEDGEQQQSRETSSPSPMIVLRSAPGRATWTKRLSKTIQRRSGSFINTLTAFRKNIDQNQSNANNDKLVLPSPLQHKRRASASPIVSVQTPTIKGVSSIFGNEKLSNISVATATATAATAGVVAFISSGMQQEDTEVQGENDNSEIHSEEKKKQQQQQQQKQQQKQQQQHQKQQQQKHQQQRKQHQR